MRLLRFARNDGAGARMHRRRGNPLVVARRRRRRGNLIRLLRLLRRTRSASAIKVFTNFRHYCSRTNPMTSVSLFRRP